MPRVASVESPERVPVGAHCVVDADLKIEDVARGVCDSSGYGRCFKEARNWSPCVCGFVGATSVQQIMEQMAT